MKKNLTEADFELEEESPMQETLEQVKATLHMHFEVDPKNWTGG